MYETLSDIGKELAALSAIAEYLGKDCTKTAQFSHDDFVIEDDWGCGEIKCRTYDTLFFKKHGWVMDNVRIRNLRERGYPDERVILGLMTLDNDVFIVSLEKLKRNKKQLKPAPQKCMKDDHGRKQSDRKGFIIPFNLLTKVK